ncbi:MAG: MotA/TolQ/ExbB proton channel family protein, partial [Alistipes sp.]|nr:MotA/TolQ/ExbB proton channel family protein [Alistipes sp.]
VAETVVSETEIAGDSLHHVLMQKFLEGGWEWMLPVLFCLVVGLAVVIERILYLSLATINTKKFTKNVEEALNNGGVEKAKELCRNTRGPIASIYYQGLDRYDQGLDAVEKAVVSYGSVQTGQMESGLSWIGLFIALAPMLGFMGTVVGMIGAFDAIQAAGDISPTLVAGGIKVALLTTLMGLIVAVILQIFYNYIIAKIDSLVNDMEDASITLVDLLTAYNKK